MMQRVRFVVAVGLSLVVLGLVAFKGHRWRQQAIAQDPPQQLAVKEPLKLVPPRELPIVVSDRPYPVLFVDDVIHQLTTSTDELINQKVTKNSDELRQDLKRDSIELKLCSAETKEIAPQDLYRRATESVFLVAGVTKPTDKDAAWHTSFSSAFVVHADGVLSTSAHVFDHGDRDDAVVVYDVRGKVHPIVEILAADRQADTCLFRIATKGLKPLPLGQDPTPGTPIRVMGHPGDSFFFFSAGNVANYEHDDERQLWMNVTADFGQGSSGGPVMDTAGNVIGQVSRTYTLYAGGEASNRRDRPHRTRRLQEPEAPAELPSNDPAEDATAKKRPDPQMVFKACTPVSAIRALIK